MTRDRVSPIRLSEFLTYLVSTLYNDCERIPALTDLSRELAVSVSRLREQLEVARVMGLVEVKPKTGIRRLEYSFTPAVNQSASYAIALAPDNFQAFSDLRKNIEAAYWFQAVQNLTMDDHQHLRELIDTAHRKLDGDPRQIPHSEHRELHLAIFRRVGNPFVIGLLEAYWDLYEAEGFSLYTDFMYLKEVWDYHEKMVDEICVGNYQDGHRLLVDHMAMFPNRPEPG
jgi:DNA-binding FadR family transcriptional regulator